MMQTDSLTKLGEVSCAEICFVLSKVGSLAILLLHTYHEKNVARKYVTILHINSVVQNSNIQNSYACLEAFIATKLIQRFYGTE
jgi:hypothetical protein